MAAVVLDLSGTGVVVGVGVAAAVSFAVAMVAVGVVAKLVRSVMSVFICAAGGGDDFDVVSFVLEEVLLLLECFPLTIVHPLARRVSSILVVLGDKVLSFGVTSEAGVKAEDGGGF